MDWLNANNLPWLIPVPPLVSFALIILVIGRSKLLTSIVAVTSVSVSFIMAWAVFFKATATDNFGMTEEGLRLYGSSFTWMDLGPTAFKMGVVVDPLTAIMLFMVPLAILMIFIYSVGYMRAYPVGDPHEIRYSRFLAYLSLFAGAMLTLVVADNLLLLFVGWEVMGLCSYLLIGFLIEKKSAYQAAVKAFMTTRIADVIMLVGIGYLFVETGTLNFREIMLNPEVLERLGNADLTGFLGLSAAAIIGSFLVVGTVGKSAQFPLHGWLPDAMEGPTPVSAMIHAAAMVSAGVYMVIRMFPLLEAGGNPHHAEYTLPLILMGVIGSVTALGGGILGVAQNDIKRVLAYSTISQLGFMVAALGIGAYVAAAFHLITHAFFKALLFMSSGAVIHAMEHGEHHLHAEGKHVPHRVQPGEATPWGNTYLGMHGEAPDDQEWQPTMPDGIELSFVAVPNDMRLMGGLRNRIPITAYAMLAGSLSLAGAPFISAGFWSKDEILADALLFITEPSAFDGHLAWLHILVFFSLVTAAVLTAFYTARMWVMTFLGQPRSEIAKHATLKHEHHHGHDDHAHDEHGHSHEHAHTESHAVVEHHGDEHHHDDHAPTQGFNLRAWWDVYSNSFLMQAPLVILAFFALTAGFVGIHPEFPILKLFTGGHNFFYDFIGSTLLHAPPKVSWSPVPVIASFSAFIVGAGVGYAVYGTPRDVDEKDFTNVVVGDRIWQAMQNRFNLDNVWLRALYMPFERFGRVVVYRSIDKEMIDEALHGMADAAIAIGEAIKRFNRVVIDGVGDGIPSLIWQGGRRFRSIQSGRVQQYLLFSALMLLALGTFFILQLF